MKFKLIFGILIIGLFLVSGCAQEVVCNKPYILVGTECCLDANDNSICDNDETKEEIRLECPPTEIPTNEFNDYLVYTSDNADKATVEDALTLGKMFTFQELALESEVIAEIDVNSRICMARKK